MSGLFARCLSILIYHRVVPEPDALVPDQVHAEEFDWQLALLERWFSVLTLGEAVHRLREGTLPPRAACVTFDDGYADNDVVALPMLRRRGIPATFFIATDFLDGGRMFNDTVIEIARRARGATLDGRGAGLATLPISTLAERRHAAGVLIQALKYLPLEERQRRIEALQADAECDLPDDMMMTSAQVRHLKESGMEIGAHTAGHPILASVEAERAATEIRTGRQRLETITGARVSLFAYPNGKPGIDFRDEHVRIVRDLGFEAAVTTGWGVSKAGSDPFQLPRFTPWDKSPGKFLIRLVQNRFRKAERC